MSRRAPSLSARSSSEEATAFTDAAACSRGAGVGVDEQQVFMVAPVDAHGEALETLHLHHAAAHGDGFPMEGAPSPPVAAMR